METVHYLKLFYIVTPYDTEFAWLIHYLELT